MIGIVFVSHSAKLADGIMELARQMAGAEVKLASAGGMALPGRPLGTDPVLVAKAIEEVYSEDGVLVLMDLGSAVLSAEMALNLLLPAQRPNVVLCEAPLVEGAISAAVQARVGSTMAQVLAEARGALAYKMDHLYPAGAAQVPPEPVEAPADPSTLALQWTVSNRLGLHARPAARFVQTVGRFPNARILVRNLSLGCGPVAANSINSVTMLGLAKGHTMEIVATGPEAQVALKALEALAKDHFGDRDEEPAPITPSVLLPEGNSAGAGGYTGLCGSIGMAAGPARHFRIPAPAIPQDRITDPQAEWARLLEALGEVRAQIQATLSSVTQRLDRSAVDLFQAHLLFLDDPALCDPAHRLVFEEHLNAAAAWQRTSDAMAHAYRSQDNEYLRARAADLEAVGRQVTNVLTGGFQGGPILESPGILIASDLTPAETAQLDPAMVLAICTATGGPTSHSCILARAFGIPAIVGLGEAVLGILEDTPLLVDAGNGRLIPEPDEPALAGFAEWQEASRSEAVEARVHRMEAAITLDGRRVEIGANIGSLADAWAAVEAGADSIGLLRTEFLFSGRQTAPNEDDQFATICAIGEAMAGRPIIIRTLDVGGDKPMPFLETGYEANPFLGWRAIRLCLANPEFFKVQLRAIVRAAALFPVKVMFPMIATLGELRAAKALLAQAQAEVQDRGLAVPPRLETGIMVEVPAAAVLANQFAPEVDFFSIGTNDLAQYTMAAERGNALVAALSDASQPAVLELIRQVVEAGHAQGKWVGLCGELGGDLRAIPILVGLGIDELSMGASMIPDAKRKIRTLDFPSLGESALLAIQPGPVAAQPRNIDTRPSLMLPSPILLPTKARQARRGSIRDRPKNLA
jgi:phosphocarrier protein FPr